MATRIIDGRLYKCITPKYGEMSKREAQSEATQIRARGKRVRVIKTSLGYTLWVPYGW